MSGAVVRRRTRLVMHFVTLEVVRMNESQMALCKQPRELIGTIYQAYTGHQTRCRTSVETWSSADLLMTGSSIWTDSVEGLLGGWQHVRGCLAAERRCSKSRRWESSTEPWRILGELADKRVAGLPKCPDKSLSARPELLLFGS